MYPTEVSILLDGKDITKWIFGQDTITLSNVANTWRNIDLSSYISGPGIHTLEVQCVSGVGRVEARLEIS